MRAAFHDCWDNVSGSAEAEQLDGVWHFIDCAAVVEARRPVVIRAEYLRRYQQVAPYATELPQQCAVLSPEGERCALPVHKRGSHNLIAATGLPWTWPDWIEESEPVRLVEGE